MLEATGGNRTKAASALKIGSATLHRKLKSYKAVFSDPRVR
jgi:DNA-binding protein Fis